MKELNVYIAIIAMAFPCLLFLVGAIVGSLWAMLLGISGVFLIAWTVENLA